MRFLFCDISAVRGAGGSTVPAQSKPTFTAAKASEINKLLFDDSDRDGLSKALTELSANFVVAGKVEFDGKSISSFQDLLTAVNEYMDPPIVITNAESTPSPDKTTITPELVTKLGFTSVEEIDEAIKKVSNGNTNKTDRITANLTAIAGDQKLNDLFNAVLKLYGPENALVIVSSNGNTSDGISEILTDAQTKTTVVIAGLEVVAAHPELLKEYTSYANLSNNTAAVTANNTLVLAQSKGGQDLVTKTATVITTVAKENANLPKDMPIQDQEQKITRDTQAACKAQGITDQTLITSIGDSSLQLHIQGKMDRVQELANKTQRSAAENQELFALNNELGDWQKYITENKKGDPAWSKLGSAIAQLRNQIAPMVAQIQKTMEAQRVVEQTQRSAVTGVITTDSTQADITKHVNKAMSKVVAAEQKAQGLAELTAEKTKLDDKINEVFSASNKQLLKMCEKTAANSHEALVQLEVMVQAQQQELVAIISRGEKADPLAVQLLVDQIKTLNKVLDAASEALKAFAKDAHKPNGQDIAVERLSTSVFARVYQQRIIEANTQAVAAMQSVKVATVEREQMQKKVAIAVLSVLVNTSSQKVAAVLAERDPQISAQLIKNLEQTAQTETSKQQILEQKAILKALGSIFEIGQDYFARQAREHMRNQYMWKTTQSINGALGVSESDETKVCKSAHSSLYKAFEQVMKSGDTEAMLELIEADPKLLNSPNVLAVLVKAVAANPQLLEKLLNVPGIDKKALIAALPPEKQIALYKDGKIKAEDLPQAVKDKLQIQDSAAAQLAQN